MAYKVKTRDPYDVDIYLINSHALGQQVVDAFKELEEHKPGIKFHAEGSIDQGFHMGISSLESELGFVVRPHAESENLERIELQRWYSAIALHPYNWTKHQIMPITDRTKAFTARFTQYLQKNLPT